VGFLSIKFCAIKNSQYLCYAKSDDTMKHHFIIRLTALAIGILFAANAQTSEEPMRHWQASIEASTYNTLDWGLELGINYRPIK
jgi:hypothetical protein